MMEQILLEQPCKKADSILKLVTNFSNKSFRTRLIHQLCSNIVTTLCCQLCDNFITICLYQSCWDKLVTSLMFPSSLLHVVDKFFQTCWQLGTSNVKIICLRLAASCEIFTCVILIALTQLLRSSKKSDIVMK